MNPNSTHNDINNYLMIISFAKSLDCRFYTIHHELMLNTDEFEDEDTVYLFNYIPNDEPVNQELLNVFASNANRRVQQVQEFIR